MKIYDVEIPADLEIPELDDKTRAELEATLAEIRRYRREEEQRLAASPLRDWQPAVVRFKECPPPSPPSIDVEALRRMPPKLRAIFVFAHRDDVTY
ncbi:hypothetical protein [Rugamonas aquatica]|uniref:Uncharacterized protein n=1 Tax=Rugamonas aquatica TaxID=2743357 RepID=A0A6A7N8P5_9BURK|nr:hypothetical protein [Rugamonas aquatica]MQA41433.1 hypothetical protein [Rugamonas aquatica]